MSDKVGGGWLKVGYLPDAFGHASQMPQILAGFGIEAAAFARGAPENVGMEAWWRSPDGTEVLAVVQKGFYCNSGGSPDRPEDVPRWFAGKRAWAKPLSATRHFLLMNGCDHVGFDPYILANIK
jgi:mannosylglycerate hydrolase